MPPVCCCCCRCSLSDTLQRSQRGPTAKVIEFIGLNMQYVDRRVSACTMHCDVTLLRNAQQLPACGAPGSFWLLYPLAARLKYNTPSQQQQQQQFIADRHIRHTCEAVKSQLRVALGWNLTVSISLCICRLVQKMGGFRAGHVLTEQQAEADRVARR